MPDYYTAEVPASLLDPSRADRFLRTVQVLTRGWSRITQLSTRPTPVSLPSARALTVAKKTIEASGVVGLHLTDTSGHPLPPWDPGAHIDLRTPSGRTRQYSLCGAPDDVHTYRVAVRRLGDRGVSAEIHDDLAEGSIVEAGHPRNLFPFATPQLSRSSATNVVFVAGGIGITALLPMVESAQRTGAAWQLTYFGHSPQTMPFLDRITAAGKENARIITTATTGRPEASALISQAETGTAVYYCGPAQLARPLRERAMAAGAVGFHFERFSPPPVISGTPFALRLARTDTTITVGADETALDAVLKRRPDTPYACRQGFCGSCRVKVVGGNADNRSHAPFLAAPDTMLLCTDRAHGPNVSIDF